MTLRSAALAYARHGWPVFPLQRRDKRPITDRGFLDATADPDTVGHWWAKHPAANIGFPPGRAGLIVFDWDTPDGQREAQRLGLYSEPTLIVETARGEHIYARHPGGHIGNQKLAPGLDVRADAGYVLLPPSIHPTGVIYTAHGTVETITACPPAVVEALQRPPTGLPFPDDAPPVDAGTPRRRAYVVAAIEDECLTLAGTPEGGRNNALNAAAFSLARFAATGEANPGKLIEALTAAARHAGLPDWEIQKTIASAFDARGVVV